MYPSHARMFMAPIHTEIGQRRNTEFQGSMEGWAEFIQEMQSFYQVGGVGGSGRAGCRVC
jgi:protein arginine N-methyltransferase 1